MINFGNNEFTRGAKGTSRRPAVAGFLLLGAVACSPGGSGDAASLDSGALAAPTTASTATGTVAASDSGSTATMAATPAPTTPSPAATTPAAQPSAGVAGVNRDTTPSPVTRDGAEQLKTRSTTTPSEAKRLDAATRAVARQGATTRDTARTGAVTPPPPVRKAAAQPAASTPATTPAASTTGAAAASSGGTSAAAATPAATPAAAPAQQQASQQQAGAQGGDRLAASPAAYQGWKTFHVYCYRCHGTDALGSDLAPNLRHSVGPQGSLNHDAFIQTVAEGRLEKGMPAWKEMLTKEQMENVYVYVKARSTGELAAGRPRQKQ